MRQVSLRRNPKLSRMRKGSRHGLLISRAVLIASAVFMVGQARAQTDGAEFFEKNVRPLFAQRCWGCHAAGDHPMGGLRLDSRESVLQGGSRGTAIVAGKPEESLLIRAVRQTSSTLRMPPGGKLTDPEIATLAQWVAMGAPWGSARVPQPEKTSQKFWAFTPPKDSVVPAVKNSSWVKSPIDAFVLDALEAKGLTPAPPAGKRELIRRATFDLTGLPPKPEEVQAFLIDHEPDAFAHVVDLLLASPRYGERWGRHWLDVARYADTKGYVFQEERRYPFAFTYRDWVIRSLNEDLPYDQFLIQQIAADRLPLGEDKRPLAAMGFLTLGRRFLNRQPDIIDDRIDVLCRGTMGLTVACARCHDHKFDPIPTKDYYSLYGVFASSIEPKDPPLIGMGQKT